MQEIIAKGSFENLVKGGFQSPGKLEIGVVEYA